MLKAYTAEGIEDQGLRSIMVATGKDITLSPVTNAKHIEGKVLLRAATPYDSRDGPWTGPKRRSFCYLHALSIPLPRTASQASEILRS